MMRKGSDAAAVLAGLDEVRWAELSHAYGEAADTPELLRQVAAPDPEVAREAVSELHGSIFHQGTVYPATVPAVSFLAGLARHAPHRRAELTWMLGMLADSAHAYGDEFPEVREAVRAQLPALRALLADDDPEVREAAAYAAAHAGSAPGPLWARWRAEAEIPVRASLALALGQLDPAGAEPVLADAVLHAEPPVRVAAAIALLRAASPWPEGTITAVVEAIDAGATVTYCWAHGGDWSDELSTALAAPAVLDLLGRQLASHEPKTRRLALWGAAERCDASRSATTPIVALVAGALADPDPEVRDQAVDTLGRLGAAAGRHADSLAAIAAGFPWVAWEAGFTTEYRATQTLARLGDPRWVEPVCAAAAAGHRSTTLLQGARREPVVLATIRERLAAEPARADVLAAVLGGWRATEAVPELVAALPHAGRQAAWALLEVGHDDPAAVPDLRAFAAQNGGAAAALAVHRMTGDAQPLLQILRNALTNKSHAQVGAEAMVTGPGDVLRPLLPLARARLTGAADSTHPQRQAQVLAARIVAALDGVPPVLPTLRAVLAGGNTPACSAAELVADLAPAHGEALAECEPLLRDRLGDRWNRLAAARALARLGVPVGDLTEALIRGVTDYGGRYGLATIRELRAVDTIPALEDLATSDERLPVTASADALVWSDEALVEGIRATIADLRATTPGR